MWSAGLKEPKCKLMRKEDCRQFMYGPTPCFSDVEYSVCSLDFCPAEDYLDSHPDEDPFRVLDSHCVMSDHYGVQTESEKGKGEYIETIAELANNTIREQV